MTNLVKSELIKGRHSFVRKVILLFPLLCALLAIILMGGSNSQIGIFNWWYILLLPTVIALICINLIDPDKRLNFFNISILARNKNQIWFAKILTGESYLLLANLLVVGITSVTGMLFGSQYETWRGVVAFILLTISFAWQLPFGMFLVTRFNSAVTVISLVGLDIFFGSQPFAGTNLWMVPFAIPARLMAPILGINPNGVPLTDGSSLYDTDVLIPGIFISCLLFIAGTFLSTKWFELEEI